jgi:hypothetical protein
MNRATGIMAWMALCCTAGIASAQQPGTPPAPPPPKPTAQSEAGEPRADTSSPSTKSPTGPATGPAAAPPAPAASGTPAKRAPADPATGPKSAAKNDRLELGTATVTGDREQPKVMYIVPWKRSDIGDLTGKPMNSLVDEILAPVDRDVFKREVVYYGAVQAEASQNGAPPKP